MPVAAACGGRSVVMSRAPEPPSGWPEGDGAAVRVGELRVGTGLGVPGREHGGERLVDLEGADVGEREARALERLGRRRDRAGEHDDRVDAGQRDGVDAGERGRARARGAFSEVVSSSAAEPSEICEELPAVTTPSSRNAGRSAASLSSEVSAADALVGASTSPDRRRSRRRSGPRRWRLRHARARRSAISSSCSRRERPAVGDHLRRQALADEPAVVALEHPRRRRGRRRRPCWSPSAPATSTRPRRRRRGRSGRPTRPAAAKCTACWLDPHWRSIVVPGTDSGKPAARAALRAMLTPCSPTWETQPQMTSSTSGRVDAGPRDERVEHVADRSPGCTPDSDLPGLPTPTGVRTAPTMTASRWLTRGSRW